MAKKPDPTPIETRLRAYDAEIASLESQLSESRKKRNNLLESLIRLKAEFGLETSYKAPSGKANTTGERIPNLHDRILIVLKDAGSEGLITSELQERIEDRWGKAVVLTSLQTYLSKHRRLGRIKRPGRSWIYSKGLDD